ncbi:MAG: galactokinase [Lachnospiraceae bacterium]|nr:galactokinase [Lachnospiraceae bacterium]
MTNILTLKNDISSGKMDDVLQKLYVDVSWLPMERDRYIDALTKFAALFPEEQEVEIYSAAGRSEVCGNHTDHQHGKVVATSVNLDAIAIVAGREDGKIVLQSDAFPLETIDVTQVEKIDAEEGTTTALIKGVIQGFLDRGYQVGGFSAYATSNVLVGAGLSSSAAFEGLIGVILSGLYNENKVSSTEIAIISQFAENVYFGKPCGLMDQMACDTGDMITIDFEDPKDPVCRQIPTCFEEQKISLCIVDTKGSHADLTDDYAAIPKEMKGVAACFGKEVLREVPEEEFFASIADLREKVSDRAVLRAIHFYSEEKRVEEVIQALDQKNYEAFLSVIRRSGVSSFQYLQNIYSPKNPLVQNVSVALGLSEVFLGQDKGVCRVHGGGFAGTIQAFVKDAYVQDYKAYIEKTFGEGSCHILKVRAKGAVRVL